MYSAVQTTPRSTTTSPLVRNSRPQMRSLALTTVGVFISGRWMSAEQEGCQYTVPGDSSEFGTLRSCAGEAKSARSAERTRKVVIAPSTPVLRNDEQQHRHDGVDQADFRPVARSAG